jgi:hypothetical protein
MPKPGYTGTVSVTAMHCWLKAFFYSWSAVSGADVAKRHLPCCHRFYLAPTVFKVHLF